LVLFCAPRKANLEDRSETRLNLEKVSLLPEKIKKGSDVVFAALRALKAQEDKINSRLKDCELEIASKTDSARHLGEELAKLTAALERARAAIEGEDRGADELKKEIDRESYDTDAHLEEQCRLELVWKNRSQGLGYRVQGQGPFRV
jgi:septal ring factor EnvC (AmiA/AmiB activator)